MDTKEQSDYDYVHNKTYKNIFPYTKLKNYSKNKIDKLVNVIIKEDEELEKLIDKPKEYIKELERLYYENQKALVYQHCMYLKLDAEYRSIHARWNKIHSGIVAIKNFMKDIRFSDL